MSNAYTYLSGYYDEINKGYDYRSYAKMITAVCGKKAKIFELGCGTGNLSLELAKEGHTVIASDISEDMLAIASSKLGSGKLDIRFVKADMRRFDPGFAPGAVVAGLDCANYLVKESELMEFLSCSAKCLDTGGYLIFDINTGYRFKEIFANTDYVFPVGDDMVVWENYYNEETEICRFVLDYFVCGEDGRYERLTEVQKQKYYPDEKIRELSAAAGFEFYAVYGNTKQESPRPDDLKNYYIFKKE